MSPQHDPDARPPIRLGRLLPLLLGSAVLAMSVPVSAQLPALPDAGVDLGLQVDPPVQEAVAIANGLDPTGISHSVTPLVPDTQVGLDVSAGTDGISACADASMADLCADAEIPEPQSLVDRILHQAQQGGGAVKDSAMSLIDAVQSAAQSITSLFGF